MCSAQRRTCTDRLLDQFLHQSQGSHFGLKFDYDPMEPLIKVGMPRLGMPHHYLRHVSVRTEFRKVVNVRHINNFSPFSPSLP